MRMRHRRNPRTGTTDRNPVLPTASERRANDRLGEPSHQAGTLGGIQRPSRPRVTHTHKGVLISHRSWLRYQRDQFRFRNLRRRTMTVQIREQDFRLSCVPFRAGPTIKPPSASGLQLRNFTLKTGIRHPPPLLLGHLPLLGPMDRLPGNPRDFEAPDSRPVVVELEESRIEPSKPFGSRLDSRPLHRATVAGETRSRVDVEAFEVARLDELHDRPPDMEKLMSGLGADTSEISWSFCVEDREAKPTELTTFYAACWQRQVQELTRRLETALLTSPYFHLPGGGGDGPRLNPLGQRRLEAGLTAAGVEWEYSGMLISQRTLVVPRLRKVRDPSKPFPNQCFAFSRALRSLRGFSVVFAKISDLEAQMRLTGGPLEDLEDLLKRQREASAGGSMNPASMPYTSPARDQMVQRASQGLPPWPPTRSFGNPYHDSLSRALGQ